MARKKKIPTGTEFNIGNFKFIFSEEGEWKKADSEYLKWKDLPKEVQDFYMFLLKGNLDMGDLTLNPETGVGMMNAYLKDILTNQDMLNFNKAEFLGMLLFKG